MTAIAKYIGGLEATIKKGLDTQLPELEPFEEKLRASGFPYCGLRHAFEKMRLRIKNEAPTSDFGKPYYCGNGTTTHELLQRYVGSTGDIIGHWNCRNKKCGGRRELTKYRPCPKCRGEMEYEELTVKAYRFVSGHVDGVWRAPDGKYFVIDYKTSSTYAISKQRTYKTFPYLANKAQIKAYCMLVELCFGIKISGWLLVYVARDDPKKFRKIVGDMITTSEKKKIYRMLGTYDGHFGIARDLRKWSDLKTLVEEKPCRCYEDYEEGYKTLDECPLSKVCFSNRLNEVVKDMWLEYKPIRLLEIKNGPEESKCAAKEKAARREEHGIEESAARKKRARSAKADC